MGLSCMPSVSKLAGSSWRDPAWILTSLLACPVWARALHFLAMHSQPLALLVVPALFSAAIAWALGLLGKGIPWIGKVLILLGSAAMYFVFLFLFVMGAVFWAAIFHIPM
jgi:hypothetical protein